MIVRADCFEWVPKNITPGSVPLIVTDPPYGGIVDEEWDRKWSIYDQWKFTHLIADALVEGGTAYVWGGIGTYGNRLFFEWLANLETGEVPLGISCPLRIWDVITWRKRRAYGCKNRYLFTREECAMLVKGDEPGTFNIPLLSELRGYEGYSKKYPAKSPYLRRTNVWDDVTEIFRGKIHPTEKPSRLAEIMIETSSNPGDLVVDFFAGSGSTGVAAKKLGRKCILIEKSNCRMYGDTNTEASTLHGSTNP